MSHTAIARQVEDLASSAAVQAVLPTAGRILISLIFVLSGLNKLAAPAMTIGYIESVGLPFPTLAYGTALIVEIIGGLALALGYQTRLVAAVLAVFSVATAVSFHNDLADVNQFVHFFKNVAMAGGLLNVIALGGGKLSIDGWRR
ncbi:DoxX family protein [Sinorhizobium sp. RAC02]|uniref:DoxX family protein n=1 Tax=Sinorhizobium sp. RAC02 TaxID=1842534 RepID=UPI00083E2ECB|nr:DoxX family protein [Sinorhizobium sp. RAC02]AOF94257.1 SURF4 family protein [Sinorhizobium sp. RAC02]